MRNEMIGRREAAGNAWLRSIAMSGVLLSLLGVPQQAAAATADAQFQQYIIGICSGSITPPLGVVWDTVKLGAMCQTTGGGASPGVSVSANLGTGNAGNRLALRNKVIRQSLGEEEEKVKPKKKGASADGGGWGLLFAPQYGKSKRIETNLENGFNTDLVGLGMGLDYRFSDRFILGALAGHIKDEATFLNSAGKLDTKSNTLTMYGTWLPTDSFSVDGYLGYGQIKLDSQRKVTFGTINDTASGNTTGKQIMGGFSASYQRDFGRVNVSPFINLNSIKTTFDGYNETGNTSLELHFNDRKSLSTTSSIGARASTAHGYRWGSLSPSVRVAAVHEYQNNAVQISNELVATPGAEFLVATDAPDRNYLSTGAGAAAALNNGTQLFFNYEARVKDKFLTSWAVSGGVLMEF